jgi:hypothetical protein
MLKREAREDSPRFYEHVCARDGPILTAKLTATAMNHREWR